MKKPLLLIFPFGYLSHYLRCLELASHLKDWYEIRFQEDQDYTSFIRDAGFETFECETFDKHRVLAAISRFDFSWLNEKDIRRVFSAQMEVIKKMEPAMVLGDAMPALSMAAEVTNTPCINLINGYMTRYYAIPRGMPQLHPLYSMVASLPAFMRQGLVTQGERMGFRHIHKPFRHIRKEYGLAAKKDYQEEMEGTQTWICDLPSLFPQKSLPDSHRFIGPLLPVPTFSSGKQTLKNINRHRILVSMGSTGNWKQTTFLNDRRFAAFEIIAAGTGSEVLTAAHISHSGFVNLGNLLPTIDLVICHGGNGTMYHALAAGIPVLCVPVHVEQEWNAGCLVQHHLGGIINPTQTIPELFELITSWIARARSETFQRVHLEIEKSLTSLHDTIGEQVQSLQSLHTMADNL